MASRFATPVLVLLLLAPHVVAGWSMKGAYEPDTSHDAGRMWTDPDHTPTGRRLYFNGFGSAGGPVATTLNPNLASERTALAATPFLAVAMFGIWKDCDRDGYVGSKDQGLLEYPSAMLLDTSICPPTIGAARPWHAHNDGTWVVEFMPLGYDDVTTPGDSNPLNVNDTAARVWADWGLPGEAPALTCVVAPAPYGTFRSTGGLLRYLDCFSGHRVAPGASALLVSAGQGALGFQDAPPDRPDRSRSPLNVANPWGSASDPPVATAFDCRDPQIVEVMDPTGGGLRNVATLGVPGGPVVYVNLTDPHGRVARLTIPAPAPAIREGSPAGSMNETQAALTDCDRDNGGEILDLDGHQDGSDADLPYALETGGEPVSHLAPRTRTDHVLIFREGARGGALAPLLGGRVRDDGGLGTAAVSGSWYGMRPGNLGPDLFLDRGDLGPAPVTHITYYAYASPLLLLHEQITTFGALGLYGAEACARSPSTFDCDPDNWWRNSAGEDVTPRDAALGEEPGTPARPDPSDRTKVGVTVWMPYVARDVDCIDMSARSARSVGVHWGTLSGTACERP